MEKKYVFSIRIPTYTHSHTHKHPQNEKKYKEYKLFCYAECYYKKWKGNYVQLNRS